VPSSPRQDFVARLALSCGIQEIEEFSHGKNETSKGTVRQHDFQ
jgi:hypothetical protein